MRRRQRCFGSARIVQASSITVLSLVRLGFRTPLRSENVRFVFVVSLLSVTLVNDKVCERHFAINAETISVRQKEQCL